tara:strand:- start:4840 stop:5454 length:615 start_codon:yes stop_codon:yes gene_type:complete
MTFVEAGDIASTEVNSSGFRMTKELDDIDLDNYCLFLGSSHTEGVGVRIDQRYSTLVSAVLRGDEVNLGVGGGGIDAVEHNLLSWFMYTDKLPKCLVIEWPAYQRYMRDIHGQKNLCPAGAWSNPEFLVHADSAMYVKAELAYHNLHRLSPIKIIDVMHSKIVDQTWQSLMIWHSNKDVGTDGAHPGSKSHLETAENILAVLDR